MKQQPSSSLDLDLFDLQYPAHMNSAGIFNSAEWPSTPCLEDLINEPYSLAPPVMETGSEQSALVTALSHLTSEIDYHTNISLTSYDKIMSGISPYTPLPSDNTGSPPDECSSSTRPSSAKSPFSWDPLLEEEQQLDIHNGQPPTPEMYPASVSQVPSPSESVEEHEGEDDKSLDIGSTYISLTKAHFLSNYAEETCFSPPGSIALPDSKLPVLEVEELAAILNEPTAKNPEPDPDEKSQAPSVKTTLKEAIKKRRRSKGMSDIVIEPKKPRKEELTEADVYRLQRRQASNRRAASKCRQKKKQQDEEQKQLADNLEAENADLRRIIAEERAKCKRMEDHMKCCPYTKLGDQ